MGKARAEVPRWRRQKEQAPQIKLRGRQQDKLVREVAAALAAQGHPAAAGTSRDGGGGMLARSGAYRFRRQLIPVGWIGVVFAVGLGTHHAGNPHAGVMLGLVAAVVIFLFSRHLAAGSKRLASAMAVLTAIWMPVLAYAGTAKPWAALAACSWSVLQAAWSHHYRWRPAQATTPKVNDHDRWNALADERRWKGHLGTVEMLPGGGRRYPIQLDGIKTTIGSVLSASENVAGAWHKPMTEAYAERDPQGVTSRGYLTILGSETLMRVREWNGAGMDMQTGLAVIGRYADGSPVHVKFYTPGYGIRHALLSGTTGSGKSELLNELIFIALVTGCFVPVILDPQEGQSLPFWRDRCLYAAGVDECFRMLRGLHAGMLDRSRYLSGLRWDDDGIAMRGMPFFNYELTGLPMPLIFFDEAHMCLKGEGKGGRQIVEKTVEISRLGRKTGTGMWLATHIPSLSELGNEQALRDMLRGGNVISMRTANRVASGMLGLEKDPSEIPMFLADGRETYGLGYCAGPDNRPDAPMRTDLVPKAMRRKVPQVPSLDERFLEAMDRAMGDEGVQVPLEAPPFLVPVPDDGPPDQPGKACADAVTEVLRANGRPMERGDIYVAIEGKAREWGRPRPWSLSALRDALNSLTKAGIIDSDVRGVYSIPRATLQLAGNPGPGGKGA